MHKKHPVYNQVMEALKPGYVFVVFSLDHAFRSSLDALAELDKLHRRNIQFLSITQNFDTITPDGEFIYTLTAALATWEQEILSMRTKEGLEGVRRRGKTLGKSRKLSDEQIAQARQMLEADFYSSITEVAESFVCMQRKLDRHSAIDMLSQLSNSRIGALQWTKAGEEPDYGMGCDIQFIESAEIAAQSVDNPESISDHLDEVSLLYLANAGTGVGGARPKALVHENGTPYLAKFNRRSLDPYDIVPSLITGAYPIAGYQYSPTAPKPSEIATKGNITTYFKRLTSGVYASHYRQQKAE